MNSSERVFSLLFFVMGIISIVSGLRFEKKYAKIIATRKDKKEFVKLNKTILVAMGVVMLIGNMLTELIKPLRSIMPMIVGLIIIIMWIGYAIICKKSQNHNI